MWHLIFNTAWVRQSVFSPSIFKDKAILIPTSTDHWLTASYTHPELFFEDWIKLNQNLCQLQHTLKKIHQWWVAYANCWVSFCSHSLLGSPFTFPNFSSTSRIETWQGCNQWLHIHVYSFQESASQMSGRHSKVPRSTEQVLQVLNKFSRYSSQQNYYPLQPVPLRSLG